MTDSLDQAIVAIIDITSFQSYPIINTNYFYQRSQGQSSYLEGAYQYQLIITQILTNYYFMSNPLYLNLAQYREESLNTSNSEYKSKYVQKLLQSDDSESEDENADSFEEDSLQIPALVSKSYNPNQQLHQPKSNIKYESFRIEGKQLIADQTAKQNSHLQKMNLYNIKDDLYQQLLQAENQISSQQSLLKKKQTENSTLLEEISLAREESRQKDQEIIKLKLELSKLQNSLRKKEQQFQVLSNEQKENQSFQENTPNYAKAERQIYQKVQKSIVKAVTRFKQQLLDKKMSPKVEEVIENFMTEIVEVNPINPIKERGNFVSVCHEPRKSILEQVMLKNYKTQMDTTPKKENREKSADLRELEKSLHKLKAMQKSFVSGNTVDKQNFDSLDRSSLMMVDRNDRSRSRRKKIFQ